MGLAPATIIWVAIILVTLFAWVYVDLNHPDQA